MAASVKIQIKHPGTWKWLDLGELSLDDWELSRACLVSMVMFAHPGSILRTLDEEGVPLQLWSEKKGWGPALYVVFSSRRAA